MGSAARPENNTTQGVINHKHQHKHYLIVVHINIEPNMMLFMKSYQRKVYFDNFFSADVPIFYALLYLTSFTI